MGKVDKFPPDSTADTLARAMGEYQATQHACEKGWAALAETHKEVAGFWFGVAVVLLFRILGPTPNLYWLNREIARDRLDLVGIYLRLVLCGLRRRRPQQLGVTPHVVADELLRRRPRLKAFKHAQRRASRALRHRRTMDAAFWLGVARELLVRCMAASRSTPGLLRAMLEADRELKAGELDAARRWFGVAVLEMQAQVFV